MNRTRIAAAVSITLAAAAVAFADLPAFPGAEGPGANATGGRGKPVYHVTNLNNDGPGSFRDAVSQGDRFVVFDVGGTIDLMPPGSRGWIRTKAGNLTVAGETAPGDGITIKGQGVKFTGNNVILRNLKIRPGMDQSKPGIATNDGITNYLQNSIIDHVSISWADDEALSTSDSTKNCTVQYALIGEVLNYHGHGFGALIATENPDTLTSYHHNLFSSVKSRLPRVGSEKGSGSILNFSNNIIYNWTAGQAGYSAFDVDDLKKGKKTSQPSRTNFLANYYIGGPDTKPTDPTFNSASRATAVWLESDLANKVDLNGNQTLDGTDLGWKFFKGDYTPAAGRFPVPSGYVESADDAYNTVLRDSGAFWWHRDAVDARIIDDTKNFRGKNLKYAEDAPGGGWIKQAETKRESYFDSDGDGIPDAWETAHGLDPKKDDSAGSYDKSGYTNLELYCHDVAAFPAPKPLAFTAKAGRFEEPGNWELSWKPSRYDTVDVKASETMSVDSPGEAVGTLRVAAGGAVDLVGGSFGVSAMQLADKNALTLHGGVLWLTPGVIGDVPVKGGVSIAGGTLRVDVDGPDKVDRMTVAGEVNLGGDIDVHVVDERPKDGARLKFIKARKITGTPTHVSDDWAVEVVGNEAFLVPK